MAFAFPTRAPNIAAPEKRCWPRRSSFAATSSAWPSSAGTLPPGGEVKKNYASRAKTGPASFADLFGDKDTLVVYNYMSGPQRERPCPMCTSPLSAWDGEVLMFQQRVALAVVARSPIQRLRSLQVSERGWHYLPLFSDISGEFSRDYHALTKDGGDDAAFNVFTRRQGKSGIFGAAK